jgi:hypothetical protein
VRDIDNYMADWKVIALVNGEIEAVSGPAAQDRPGADEWLVWEGQAADKAEALKCAEKADPRIDLEWMRIRCERELNIKKKILLRLSRVMDLELKIYDIGKPVQELRSTTLNI